MNKIQKLVLKEMKAVGMQGNPEPVDLSEGVMAAKAPIMAIVQLLTQGSIGVTIGRFVAHTGEDVGYAEVAVKYDNPEFHSVLPVDRMKNIVVLLERASSIYNAWAKKKGMDKCEAVVGFRPGSNNKIYVGVTFNPSFDD